MTSIKSVILLLIPFLFFIGKLNSQSLITSKISVDDGLLSMEVLDILQDDNGFIWIATGLGVSKYNGYSFENFTTQDGLPSNSVIKLFKDRFGRIWFVGYAGHISYYENGQIVVPKYNAKLNKLLGKGFVNNIFVDDNKDLWLTAYNGKIYQVENDSILHLRNFNFSDKDFEILFYKSEEGFNYTFSDNYDHSNTGANVNGDKPEMVFKNDTFRLKYNKMLRTYFVNYVQIDDNEFFFSINNDLVQIKNNKIVAYKEFEGNQPISYLYGDKSGNLWVSILANGVYFYNNHDLNQKAHNYFRDKTISRVFQDHEDSYWFTTLSDGIYYTPNLNFKKIDKTEGNKILSMDFNKDIIYYSTYDIELFAFNFTESFSEPTEIYKGEFVSYISKIQTLNDDITYFSGEDIFSIDSNGKRRDIETKSFIYNLNINFDSSLLAVGYYSLLNIKDNRIVSSFDFENFNERVQCAFQEKDGFYWIGTLRGLYIHDQNITYSAKKYHDAFKNRIKDIKGKGNYILFASHTDGLIVKYNNEFLTIGYNEGLSSDIVNIIYPENDKTFWVGTNRGLNKIVFDGKNYSILNISKAQGLNAYEINDIKYHEGLFYLSTDKGIIYFDPREVKQIELKPILRIESLLVNYEQREIVNDLRFNFKENNLIFNYHGLGFKSPKDLVYSYKLEGLEDTWHITNELNVRYTNLNPGKYSFKLKVNYEQSSIESIPVNVDFEILKPFFLQWSFLIPILIVILLLFYLMIYLVLKSRQKKHEIQKRILITEQNSLRNQMNPHFIFNSLSSIQRYILENNIELADQYLADFASLIRIVMENSKRVNISLKEEIESLEIYLKLEKIRISKKLDYSIKIDSHIDIDKFAIPPMLIQPFIENSIWHGITPSDNDGKIKVEIIQIDAKTIKIQIEDNGIGLEESKKIQKIKKGHNSTAITNVKERLYLMNKTYKTNNKIDISDNTGEGTTVIIIFQSFFND